MELRILNNPVILSSSYYLSQVVLVLPMLMFVSSQLTGVFPLPKNKSVSKVATRVCDIGLPLLVKWFLQVCRPALEH